jgi:probable phosphoglycerate mutase
MSFSETSEKGIFLFFAQKLCFGDIFAGVCMQAGAYNSQRAGFVGEENNALLVCFIRHAESESNVGRPTTYTHQDRLTERGKRQAEELPRQVEEISRTFKRQLDLIITSPYRRARETARPTRLTFPDATYRIWPVEEFTYLGSMGGKPTTNEDRQKKRREFWSLYDPDHTDDTGESFNHFMARVRLILECLRHQEAHFIVVFSHEQFIQAVHEILSRGLAEPFEPFETPETMQRFRRRLNEWSIPNCHISPTWLPKAENNSYQCQNHSSTKIPRYLLAAMCKR